MKTLSELRTDAIHIYRAALRAADARLAVLNILKRNANRLSISEQSSIIDLSHGRVIVVGAGKAGAAMAQAVEEVLGDSITAGALSVKYGHTAPTEKIKLYEAGHPLPDENGVRATQAIMDLLRGMNENDLVLCLLSGGGSALLELPVPGVTLDDVRVLTNELLRSGATINEMNALRKHLSQIKGGQLARLVQPARVVSLILSDVLGSPLDVIASGPTAPDSTTFADAMAIIQKYQIRDKTPLPILDQLERGMRGEIADTPKANDPLFARVTNVIVADNRIACESAAGEANARGYVAEIISTRVEGEACEIGAQLAMQASQAKGPRCLIAGGEPTVKLHGHGKGGRAQELVLSAARELAGTNNIVILSAGTDGTDGPTDAAGAIADGKTLARAEAQGLDANAFLENNDSYHFFHALDDLIITGPTNTNVNDLMIALIG